MPDQRTMEACGMVVENALLAASGGSFSVGDLFFTDGGVYFVPLAVGELPADLTAATGRAGTLVVAHEGGLVEAALYSVFQGFQERGPISGARDIANKTRDLFWGIGIEERAASFDGSMFLARDDVEDIILSNGTLLVRTPVQDVRFAEVAGRDIGTIVRQYLAGTPCIQPKEHRAEYGLGVDLLAPYYFLDALHQDGASDFSRNTLKAIRDDEDYYRGFWRVHNALDKDDEKSGYDWLTRVDGTSSDVVREFVDRRRTELKRRALISLAIALACPPFGFLVILSALALENTGFDSVPKMLIFLVLSLLGCALAFFGCALALLNAFLEWRQRRKLGAVLGGLSEYVFD